MRDIDRDVLRMLRLFGPCSNTDIARRLKEPLHRTYAALGRLVKGNLASHPKLQRWQITPRGLRVFNDMPNKSPVVLPAE